MAVDYFFVGMSFTFAIGFVFMLLAFYEKWPLNTLFHFFTTILFLTLSVLFLHKADQTEAMIVFNLAFWYFGIFNMIMVLVRSLYWMLELRIERKKRDKNSRWERETRR